MRQIGIRLPSVARLLPDKNNICIQRSYTYSSGSRSISYKTFKIRYRLKCRAAFFYPPSHGCSAANKRPSHCISELRTDDVPFSTRHALMEVRFSFTKRTNGLPGRRGSAGLRATSGFLFSTTASSCASHFVAAQTALQTTQSEWSSAARVMNGSFPSGERLRHMTDPALDVSRRFNAVPACARDALISTR